MVEKTLEKTKELVFPRIKKYLKDPKYPKQFEIPDKYKKEVNQYWKITKDYPERKGKYLRPTLVRLIASALGNNSPKVLQVATAMQISEEWILISDDVEDKSEARRGKPTLHNIYGNELAINASDALESIMWKAISDCNNKKVTEEFNSILLRTTLGQAVEQIWTNKKVKVNKDQYFFIADGKSGYYSIAGPMRLGAIISNATTSQINKITDFGLHLGRCFQLTDDILDFDEDKKEGKKTLATLNGIKFTKALAEEEKQKSLDIFNNQLKFLSNQQARKELEELIHFIVERDI